MNLPRHRLSALSAPTTAYFAAFFALVVLVSPVASQETEWRVVENPYQEDIEYQMGAVHNPGVEVEGVRWRSLQIETGDRGLFTVGETVEAQVHLELENRRPKSAKILVILLLEDEDGDPLDRVEVRQFKVAGGRLKERTENVRLLGEVLNSTHRIYVFFEVLQ